MVQIVFEGVAEGHLVMVQWGWLEYVNVLFALIDGRIELTIYAIPLVADGILLSSPASKLALVQHWNVCS